MKLKDVVTDAMGFQEISSRNNSFLEVNSDYYHCYYYNYFKMALHSNAETWLKLMKETEDGFLEHWDVVKPLFKKRFGKKMDVAKIGQVLDNLKM